MNRQTGIHMDNRARGAFLLTGLVLTIGLVPGPHAAAHLSVSVWLSAAPKIVSPGARTELTAHLSPCEGHEGAMVEFFRLKRRIATAPTDEFCVATVRVRLKRTALFRAALFEGDHLTGVSTQVKVRVR